jgi:hypothetical protein
MPRQEVNTHHGRNWLGEDTVNPWQWRQAYVHGKFGDVRSGSFATEPSRASDEQCLLCAESYHHPSRDRLACCHGRKRVRFPPVVVGHRVSCKQPPLYRWAARAPFAEIDLAAERD